MFNRNIFGTRLRLLRREKDVTQQVISQLLSVTKTQISEIENGKSTTTLERLVILSDYFDVSCDYLLGITDVRKK